MLCHRSLELIFKANLKLESGNQELQYGCQAAILKVTSLKIKRLLPMTTINMHIKFETEIPKQTWLMLRIPCRLPSLETEKSNMAARPPFWKWRTWKSIGSYPYTKVLCRWSLELIFKAKLKLESGNQKSNMAARRPFWKWRRSWSISFCLWPPSTCIWNLKLKFWSKLDLCSGNHVVYRQTDSRTGRRRDGRTDKVTPVYPPLTSLGGGINTFRCNLMYL